MRANWRVKRSVLAGASALALSVVVATPALADEPSGGLEEIQMPGDVEIIEGVAPAPGTVEPLAGGMRKAAAVSGACLGSTSIYGAKGCYQPGGDIVWSRDTEKDGLSAAVGIYTDYGRPAAVCINTLGADTWATCNKDYRENGNVRLRILRYNGDNGKFYQPESWSGWIPVDGRY
ncbi:hypothetical protein [Streptomyces spectabilis]|uniref:Uncharacterized protein n=1 Tax=Streptomyces spectabilis TaxID=68270 RepID=A0A516R1I6_STRST|nr:hypothetical protein [Streptomyces spectabilis]QDQ09516.1 hypothetical protein FH965_02205 [Streptomyces spectabilis]